MNVKEGLWLANILTTEAKIDRNSQQIWQFRSENDWTILIRNKNKAGTFLKLMVSKNRQNPKYLFIPGGKRYLGWIKLGGDIRLLISSQFSNACVHPSSSSPVSSSLVPTRTGILPSPPSFASLLQPKQLCSETSTPTLSSPVISALPALKLSFPHNSRWSSALVFNVSNGLPIWFNILKWFCVTFKISDEISLLPISESQAIYFADSEDAASSILLSFESVIPPCALSIVPWSESIYPNSPPIGWSSTGEWVSVCFLPQHLWSTAIFQLIGDRCGGLLEIHGDTISERIFTNPLLRVRGPLCGSDFWTLLEGKWVQIRTHGKNPPAPATGLKKVSGSGKCFQRDFKPLDPSSSSVSIWPPWKLTIEPPSFVLDTVPQTGNSAFSSSNHFVSDKTDSSSLQLLSRVSNSNAILNINPISSNPSFVIGQEAKNPPFVIGLEAKKPFSFSVGPTIIGLEDKNTISSSVGPATIGLETNSHHPQLSGSETFGLEDKICSATIPVEIGSFSEVGSLTQPPTTCLDYNPATKSSSSFIISSPATTRLPAPKLNLATLSLR